jgi:predicted MPP superfamily phosphohydrolase
MALIRPWKVAACASRRMQVALKRGANDVTTTVSRGRDYRKPVDCGAVAAKDSMTSRFAQCGMLERPNRVNILVSHCPTVFNHAAERGVDLMLAGHAHGGQVKPPGIRVFVHTLTQTRITRSPASSTPRKTLDLGVRSRA